MSGMATEADSPVPFPPHHDDSDATPLLGTAHQEPHQPLRLNLILGSAPIAQLGAWLFLLVVWYELLTNKLLLASLHPLGNSLLLLLLVNSILLLQPTHTPEQKRTGTWGHATLNGAALGVGVVAAVAMIVHKQINTDHPHFESVHARFGVATYLLLLGQALVGVVQYFLPNLIGGVDNGKKLYKYHRVGGYVVLGMVLVTAVLGTQTDWIRSLWDVRWVWIVAVVLILVGIVPRINPHKFQFF
ncbi:hypothetical protein SAICODRAFT_17699 [Saitoella complicata NRRL Y-17804]|nr:uncharacterized protein SAICODRAFT_17699 [Saitoella complicata NRRL Y-17804]ODQ54702.1 hypothetical protein SAICODRAFT_17699 [Saitoella complicata NRRL Y-17804]